MATTPCTHAHSSIHPLQSTHLDNHGREGKGSLVVPQDQLPLIHDLRVLDEHTQMRIESRIVTLTHRQTVSTTQLKRKQALEPHRSGHDEQR